MIEYVILGLIQGILEWLPVSSEGSLVLIIVNALKINFSTAISLSIYAHLGTALAVTVKYNRIFKETILLRDQETFKLLIMSTLGTCITAVPILLYGLKNIEFNETVNVLIGLLLMLTGAILLIGKKAHYTLKRENPSIVNYFVLGLLQGFAVMPGLSRSAITVSYLLYSGLTPKKALKYSFLVSVPVVLGACVLEAVAGEIYPVSILICLTVFSFITGLLTMNALLKVAEKVNFGMFCIFFGLLALLLNIA